MFSPQASAPRWQTGDHAVLCTLSRRGVRWSSGYPSPCTGQRPVLAVHNLVPLVSRVCLATLCGPVNLRGWLSPSCSLSFRKCTVGFRKGTQKTCLFRGRPRSLSSSSPFSWFLAGVSVRTPHHKLQRRVACRSGGVGGFCVRSRHCSAGAIFS